MPLIPGDELAARYRVVGPLGSGGMASVLLVDDLPARKRRVLKELRLDSPELLAAFRNEFAVLATLTHPCLTRVHDFGSSFVRGRPVHFYTADQVEGSTLREWARARKEVPLNAVLDALEGLGTLHALGLCHGDVSPENILVRPDGTGVLIDLGCARPFGEVGSVVSGTPEFMAPELSEARSVDARSDLFSLGRTLERAYQLARLQPPAEVARALPKLTASRAVDRPASAEAALEALGRAPRQGFAPLRHAPRLLGREPELDQFAGWLSALTAGTPGPRLLALRGPSGSGTSRLLRECVSRAELELVVLRASADESEAVSRLLSAASALRELPNGARGALSARDALARRTTPLLLVFEDADRLESAEASLLRAFARLLTPNFPVGLLVSGVAPLAGIAAQFVEVGPLDRASVKRWVRGALSERALTDLLATSGGLPGEIEAELARRALPDTARGGAASELEALVALEKGERLERLALLAALGGTLEPSLFGLASEDFAALGTFVRREGERIRLRSQKDLPRLVRALPAAVLRAQHARVAEVLLSDDTLDRAGGVREAEIVAHLLQAGELERARATLVRLEPVWREAPWPFARELGRLELELDAETACAIAEIALLAAEAETARRFAARALGTRPVAALAARARLLGAEALLRLGKPRRAEAALERFLSTAKGELRAAALERLARARSQRGDHAGAERAARDGLALSPAPAVARALGEALGTAASYLGRTAEAELIFERILSEVGETAPARDRVRLLGAQAIAAFRSGRALVAAERHRRALELAERHGLDDLVSVCSLNLGTALQQSGDLGGALASYERGLAVTLALGRESTELVLRYNLATLHAEIGDLVRARAELDALSSRSESVRLLQLAPAVAMLRAELEVLCEDWVAARLELEVAEKAFSEGKLERELVEVELVRAELELAEGAAPAARKRAQAAAARAERLSAEDLVLRAEWTIARGEATEKPSAARERLDRALSRARRGGQDLLEAKLATELCRVLLALGDTEASAQAERARRLWDRLASNLDQADRATFWQDPRRDVLERLTVRQPSAKAGAETAVLRRLLSLARRVNSSLSIDRVLDYAVDAAVELSGAERGFVLLATPDGPPRVAAARAGAEPLLLPSRSIVERVLESQEAVLTTDAATDARFSGHGSVHALRLKSVLSVPISTPERALGVVYVDSRLQRSRFSEGDRDVLIALADQIAVALANAQLHADLEQRSRELEQQKRIVERLSLAKDRELDALREEVRVKARTFELRYDYSQIVGRGPAMRGVLEQLDRVMDTGVNVLLLGESGTGKELAARAIHVNGPRSAGAFVGVNCAAMPETLLESELFGHVRGAFTGADRDRKGLLLEADRGTLFLDELGEMPLATQAKLLRVLQEREVRPLGASRSQPFDVRLVCATQRDLVAEVAAGRFREDLYYRVAVVVVRLPPLRERLEDLPELARSLVQRIARTAGRKVPEIGRDALRALAQHPFPGNVRELENVLTRAVVMSADQRIDAGALELNARAARPRTSRTRGEYQSDERERILEALRETRWNVSVVSRRLGIPRNTLYRKLERYGLSRAELDSAR